MKARRTILAPLMPLGVLLIAACAGGDKKADSAKMADSAAMAAAAATPPAAPAPAPLTDANILAKLDAANMADSSGGALATQKGTDASVKAFGKMMMTDHHMLRKGGQDLAKKLNISPEMPAGDMQEAMAKAAMDSAMSTPKGAEWDQWYMHHSIADHEMVLKMAQDAANTTQNADIKAMIAKATPIVQKHLDKAKEIHGKISGSSKPMGAADTMKKTP